MVTVPKVTPEMRAFVVDIPMAEYVDRAMTQKRSLNLNQYRNLHFYQLNYQKGHFHDRMRKPLNLIPELGKVWLHYEIFPNNKGRLDTMNVGSVVDKFFSDCLTETGRILDDNYQYVVFNSFCFGGLVKGSPFVRVTITELEPRKEQMRVLLDQTDIRKALEDYVSSLGLAGATGVEISTSGGELIAEVLFGGSDSMSDSDVEEAPKPKSKGGRPAGSKNKPKEEARNAGAPAQGGNGGDDQGGSAPAGDDPEDEEDDDFLNPNKGKPAENPSEGSQGASSKGTGAQPAAEDDDQGDPEEEEAKPASAPVKKSSIFDDED